MIELYIVHCTLSVIWCRMQYFFIIFHSPLSILHYFHYLCNQIRSNQMTTSYLPPISWWHQWITEGMPLFADDAIYRKRGGMNHCTIDSPNGPLTLTIPIEKPVTPHIQVSEVRLSEHGDWRHKHWHALQSTYYNSPYFEYYQDQFLPIYEGHQERLVEFNAQLIQTVSHLMGLDTIEPERLKQMQSSKSTYYQVFAHKHGFVPNLSIIDLLMNMGPESLLYI